jgi:hypothetical protein
MCDARGSMEADAGGGDMESKRSVYQEAHCESLDVAFLLRPERLALSTPWAGTEPLRSGGGAFAPAQRAGEVLHVVASALREIPFGAVDGIEIRRITDLELEKDASLDALIEVRARAIGARELAPGHQLVTIWCQLTNQFGDRVAALSVEVEAKARVSAASQGLGRTAGRLATPEPDLECVDNIPV